MMLNAQMLHHHAWRSSLCSAYAQISQQHCCSCCTAKAMKQTAQLPTDNQTNQLPFIVLPSCRRTEDTTCTYWQPAIRPFCIGQPIPFSNQKPGLVLLPSDPQPDTIRQPQCLKDTSLPKPSLLRPDHTAAWQWHASRQTRLLATTSCSDKRHQQQ